jgi:hypothetical protein
MNETQLIDELSSALQDEAAGRGQPEIAARLSLTVSVS